MAVRLEARGVEHGFGRSPVLTELHLNLEPGSATLLLGPNGSGKSTVLALFGGLLTPNAGEVLLDGCPARSPTARRGVGLMTTDDPSPRRTLRQLQGALTGTAYWEALELHDLIDVPLHTLSSGQRRRASLALAMTSGGRALLLDEPLAMLDQPNAARVLDAVIARHAAGTTLLIATHHPERWAGLAPMHHTLGSE